MKRLLAFLICFVVQFCAAQTQKTLSADDQLFFEKLIAKFERFSIEKEKIDWKEFRRQVLEKALESKDSAIVLALRLNNNPHSYFKYHDKELWARSQRKGNKPFSKYSHCPELNLRDSMEEYGYLVINGVKTNPYSKEETQEQAETYIRNLIDKITEQDERKLKGWIIDLRSNFGGNMWPMLVGLTPFYSDGILGYFFSSTDTTIYKKSDNQIWLNNESQTLRFLREPINYQLKNKDLKVAVIISGLTGSSGEALTISLKSLKNARIFGSKTYGFSTANIPMRIDEDSYLMLTVSVDADVNKVEYLNGIEPDTQTRCETVVGELKKWFEEK